MNNKLRSFLLLLSITAGLLPNPVLALIGAAKQQVDYVAVYHDPASTCPSAGTSGGGGTSTAPPSQNQAQNAQIIIGIAKTENLGKDAVLIALMVGLAESQLTILANRNVPISETNPAKQGDGADHDSVGVFQQRPDSAWSTFAPSGGSAADSNKDAVWQLMDVAYGAEAFFGTPPGTVGAPNPISKGLQNHTGWQSLSPQMAAQKVQGSASQDGSNYAKQQAAAQALLDKYFDSSPAIPLPVPFTGGSGATGGGSGGSTCTGTTTGGSVNGCANPIDPALWDLHRTDQGVDFKPKAPTPVKAICDGDIVLAQTSGTGWPFDTQDSRNGPFIIIKLTAGPLAGKCTYVAEHLINVVAVGTHVTAGQTIATALPGYAWTEWGWAAGPLTPATRGPGATPGGKAFARFLRSLGAPTQEDPGPGPMYEGNSC